MQARPLRLLVAAAIVGSFVAAPLVRPASANPITKIQQMGLAPYVIYIVKDLGGGAYWNVTTSSLYVLVTGSTIVPALDAATVLVATATADGRDLMLLVNGAIIRPIQDAL